MINDIVFICIGTNKVIGDSLGPLVGTYLKVLYHNIKVYGDIKQNIDYNNINKVINFVNVKYKNHTKVLIDSALGNNVGDIVLYSGSISLGKGIGKEKNIYGDIIIKAVVGRNYNSTKKNFYELKKRNFEEINSIARNVIDLIPSIINV